MTFPLVAPMMARFDGADAPPVVLDCDGDPSPPAGWRGAPRVGLCGTSISQMADYRQAASAVNNGNGTWTVSFAANPRPMYGEGDSVLISQGPAGLNTRNADVLSIAGNDVLVRPNVQLPLPLVGAAPLLYFGYSRAFGAWADFAEQISACAPTFTVDASLGGADTEQLLSLLVRDLAPLAGSLDAVIAEIGSMNGVYARSNSFEIEWGHVERYVRAAAKLGRPFAVLGCLPRNSATAAWSLAKAQVIARIHAGLDVLVPALGGTFLNPYRAAYRSATYLNPADANGNPRVPEATSDGVHPNTGGGLPVGAQVARWLDSLFAPADPLPASVLDTAAGMLNTNPFMQGAGGARTGGAGAVVAGPVADGCDVVVEAGAPDCTIACSVVQRTAALHGDAIGNAQRLVVTTGATASTIVRFDFMGNAAAQTANGDRLQAVAHAVISHGGTPGQGAPVGLASVNPAVLAQTATTTNKFISGNGAGTVAINQEGGARLLRTPLGSIRAPLAVHGAPSAVRGRITLYLRANASVCIDIGRCGLFKRA